MKKIYLLLCLFTLGIVSCQNNIDESVDQFEQTEGVINFFYKEVFYSSEYVASENGMFLQNEEADKVYQELQEMPELLTMVGDTLKFYDNKGEFLKYHKIENEDQVQTKVNTFDWELDAYTTVYYQGEKVHYESFSNNRFVCNKVNYDNNWGSLVMKNKGIKVVTFIFYEDGKLQGKSLLFQTYDIARIDDLRNYYRGSWGRTWDNKISSFEVY